ncbi:unnamed protein product [Symbiodinium necroappetens]|uniref:Uncharacterized protein n=1 Tax=Symbiodinium necroappetens TaxID=1628268 RepID=A0A813BHU0_9DINO|nr:unnamed protein product [Symbiodinium necroappetens]
MAPIMVANAWLDDARQHVRRLAVQILGRSCAGHCARDALDAAVGHLRDRRFFVRKGAVEVLGTGALRGSREAAIALRGCLEDASVHVRDVARRWHMRVVCSAALWLQGEDPKRETGFEILAALAKLGDRDAIIAAVQALKSLSPSCRQAGVDILGHGARAQAHPLACMALAMCVADGDQDLPTSEQIAKARQLLSLSSRDISHALDVHLESVENSSPSEAEEPEEHDHTGRTQELLQHLRQHLIAEGIAKAVRVILETAVEDPEPLTGDRTTFPRLPSDIPAALNVLSARRDNCRSLCTLFSVLKASGSFVRISAMQALRGPAEQGSLEAIAALCGSLEDDCADVREQAVDVLGGIPTQRFLLETVAKRLAHEQSHVRVAAVELLCRNSDRDGVCDVTLPYLESLNSGIRQSAIRVLASMATRSEKAMSGLRERLDDKEMEVRQEALVALCMLESPERTTHDSLSAWTP